MNNFMEINVIMGLSRVLVDGFISYPPIEGGAIWKITPKRIFNWICSHLLSDILLGYGHYTVKEF